MTLFRLIAVLVIGALLFAVLRDLRRGGRSWRGVWGFVKDETATAVRFWRGTGSRPPGSRRDNLRRMTYVLSAALLVVLAVTGFLPVLLLGDHLGGTLLIVHVTAAPLFAVSLAALALLWAYRFRFDEDDWHFILNPAHRMGATRMQRLRVALKAGFWLVLLSSLPLMGSIILGMYPLFGTEGQETLIQIHGYSALLILAASIVVIHLTIVYVQHMSEKPSKESTQ